MYLFSCDTETIQSIVDKFNVEIVKVYNEGDYNKWTKLSFWQIYIKVSSDLGHNFTIREFPRQCSWLVIGDLSPSSININKKIDEIATYIAKELEYSAIFLSDNHHRIGLWRNLGYKELFTNFNFYSGNVNTLMLKEVGK